MSKPKVLIVEDEVSAYGAVRTCLEGVAELIFAPSVNAALRVLRNHSDIAYVMLDGRVPCFTGEPLRNGDTTHALLYEVLEHLQADRIYTASSDPELNRELSAIGAVCADKRSAPQLIASAIGQNS